MRHKYKSIINKKKQQNRNKTKTRKYSKIKRYRQRGGNRIILRKNRKDKDIKEYRLTERGLEWSPGYKTQLKNVFGRGSSGVILYSDISTQPQIDDYYTTITIHDKNKTYTFDNSWKRIGIRAPRSNELHAFWNKLVDEWEHWHTEPSRLSLRPSPRLPSPRLPSPRLPSPRLPSRLPSLLSDGDILELIRIFVGELETRYIKLLVFDWDKTISKQHMYHDNIGKLGGYRTIEYVRENLNHYFHTLDNDKTVFVELVEKLREKGIRIAIASFGRCKVMADTLDMLFGSKAHRIMYIPDELILGGGYDNHRHYCAGYGEAVGKDKNKNNQLREILYKTGANNENTLFIDDTNRNLINSPMKYVHNIKPINDDEDNGWGISGEQISNMTISLIKTDMEYSSSSPITPVISASPKPPIPPRRPLSQKQRSPEPVRSRKLRRVPARRGRPIRT